MDGPDRDRRRHHADGSGARHRPGRRGSARRRSHRDDDAGAVFGKLEVVGVRALFDALERADAGTLEFAPQPEEGATYAHKITARRSRARPDRERAASCTTRCARSARTSARGCTSTGSASASGARGPSPAPTHGLAGRPGAVWHDEQRLVLGTGDARARGARAAAARQAAHGWPATGCAGCARRSSRASAPELAAGVSGPAPPRPRASARRKVTPARWAAWLTLRRTFDEDAWTDRAFTAIAEQLGARPARARVRAAARVRHRAAGQAPRPRHRDARASVRSPSSTRRCCTRCGIGTYELLELAARRDPTVT